MSTRSLNPDASMVPRTALDPPVSSGRLWFGLAGAAAAWLVMEGVGYFFVGRNCGWRTSGLGAWAFPHPAALTVGLAVVCLAVAAAALLVALGNLQRIAGVTGGRAGEPGAPAAWGRARFMAFGGIFASGLFLVGLVLFGFPALLVHACGTAH